MHGADWNWMQPIPFTNTSLGSGPALLIFVVSLFAVRTLSQGRFIHHVHSWKLIKEGVFILAWEDCRISSRSSFFHIEQQCSTVLNVVCYC